MIVVFFSNVLNHHQVALCDELFRQNNGKFYFVEVGRLDASRKAMGFKQFDREYLIRICDGETQRTRALELAIDADVAIMGADSYPYLKKRLNRGRGVTFSYSERWLKQGLKNIFSPTFLKLIGRYLFKGRKCKWYMLAASGYLANDLSRFGIFKNKVFKWGYFPKYSEIPRIARTKKEFVKILWVARFIDWKCPDMMIELAKRLHEERCDFEITMIGDGPLHVCLQSGLLENPELSKQIRLLGNKANEDVLKEMSISDIFCITSTRREGWGAVLGEAMAMGCCPVASIEAGATPLLIKDGENGLVFKTDDAKNLYEKVKYLLDNPKEREKMGRAARETMLTDWNAESAAKEFLTLARHKLENADYLPAESNKPGSIAKVLKMK